MGLQQQRERTHAARDRERALPFWRFSVWKQTHQRSVSRPPGEDKHSGLAAMKLRHGQPRVSYAQSQGGICQNHAPLIPRHPPWSCKRSLTYCMRGVQTGPDRTGPCAFLTCTVVVLGARGEGSFRVE